MRSKASSSSFRPASPAPPAAAAGPFLPAAARYSGSGWWCGRGTLDADRVVVARGGREERGGVAGWVDEERRRRQTKATAAGPARGTATAGAAGRSSRSEAQRSIPCGLVVVVWWVWGWAGG